MDMNNQYENFGSLPISAFGTRSHQFCFNFILLCYSSCLTVIVKSPGYCSSPKFTFLYYIMLTGTKKEKSPEIKLGFTNLDVFYLKNQDYFFFNVVG